MHRSPAFLVSHHKQPHGSSRNLKTLRGCNKSRTATRKEEDKSVASTGSTSPVKHIFKVPEQSRESNVLTVKQEFVDNAQPEDKDSINRARLVS